MKVFPNITSLKQNAYTKTVNGFIPKIAAVPLIQDIESKLHWLIKEGDKVQEGQKIASSDENSPYEASIFAPLPGTIKEIKNSFTPDGKKSETCYIELSGSFNYLGKKIEDVLYEKYTASQIIEKIKNFGIVNTFISNEPRLLYKEIISSSKINTPILAVRLFDEDSSSFCDTLTTKMFFDEIVKGALITAKAMNAKGIAFIYDEKNQIPELPESDLALMKIKCKAVKYPSGNKNSITTLIRKTSSLEIFKNCSKKSLFVDASTMHDLFRAISKDIPCIDKYVYISGDCLPASGFIKVKIGTTFKELSEQLGGIIKKPRTISVNGVITGFTTGTVESGVTKYVKSIVFMPASKLHSQKSTECVHCGSCRRVCPLSLTPDKIYSALTNRSESDELFIEARKICDNCGLCNSVCPSRLPLSQIIYERKDGVEENV